MIDIHGHSDPHLHQSVSGLRAAHPLQAVRAVPLRVQPLPHKGSTGGASALPRGHL